MATIADGVYIIENFRTERYAFADGKPVTKPGSEGGYGSAPHVVGADANYYGRANWKFTKQTDGTYLIQNEETKRYLLETGKPVSQRGTEGEGGTANPVAAADDNYYGRAQYNLLHKGNGKYIFENAISKRYLFQTGDRISGDRSAEKGWTDSSGFEAPLLVGKDENYNDRALFTVKDK